jgi:hypothetical protein
MRAWLSSGVETVEAGLRAGIRDGSVRPDVDVVAATTDISTSGLGLAYHWIVFDDSYQLDRELATVRDRIIGAYGTESACRR